MPARTACNRGPVSMVELAPDEVPLCVCVPARNEATRLPKLLHALSEQDWHSQVRVVVAINNSTDQSIGVVEQCAARWSSGLDLHVVEAVFEPRLAHAGSARKLAMDSGMARMDFRDDAILVSTDADARPPRHWLRSIVEAIKGGADVVGGRIDLDPEEPLPPEAARLRRMWDRYWTEVRAIEDAIDPVPWDLPPRHGDHVGASLAITVAAYRKAGGVPLMETGEDQALVTAAVAEGARLVHPNNVHLVVSPRRDGRAVGGMADAMRTLLSAASAGETPMAPDYSHWHARAQWRREMRASGGAAAIAREEPKLAAMPHDMLLSSS